MKKFLVFLLSATMIFGLAACGGSSSDSSSSDSSASDANTLYINLASEPDYLDPALNSSVDGGCLAVNSFEGLYTYNSDQELVPGIAADMPEVSDDGTKYTIKLIESNWSNGEALTANDFVYSWNRVIDENTAADYSYLFDIIARNDDGSLAVTATDDYTLEITLTNPCPYFNDLLAFPTFFPVYQAGVEAAEGTEPGAWAQEAGFVSNGAYTLNEWSHDESMVYVKNPEYHDADNVTIDELHFMLSADDTAIYAAYNNGDLDFADTIPTEETKAAMETEDFHLVDNLGTYYLAFNVNADLFSGMTEQQAKDFRHAICILIDRDYIVENIGQTGQVLADSFIPVKMADGNGGEFKGSDDSYYDANTTDVETAKSLLEGCGYTFTDNGDGTYTCDPAISLPYIINEGTGHQMIAEAMQNDLSVLGIEMTINVEDWNVFLEDRKNGNFTFAREGWLADYNDPINMLEIFTSDSGNNDAQLGKEENSFAPANWSTYDDLINQIRTSTDFAARVDLMHDAEDMLMDTWAVVPIYYYNDVYLQKTNVDGIYSTVYGMKYFMYATKS